MPGIIKMARKDIFACVSRIISNAPHPGSAPDIPLTINNGESAFHSTWYPVGSQAQVKLTIDIDQRLGKKVNKGGQSIGNINTQFPLFHQVNNEIHGAVRSRWHPNSDCFHRHAQCRLASRQPFRSNSSQQAIRLPAAIFARSNSLS